MKQSALVYNVIILYNSNHNNSVITITLHAYINSLSTYVCVYMIYRSRSVLLLFLIRT